MRYEKLSGIQVGDAGNHYQRLSQINYSIGFKPPFTTEMSDEGWVPFTGKCNKGVISYHSNAQACSVTPSGADTGLEVRYKPRAEGCQESCRCSACKLYKCLLLKYLFF